MVARRILGIVFRVLGCLVGAALIVGAIWLLNEDRDDDGFYTTDDGQTEVDCSVTQSQFPETDPEFVNVLDKAMFRGLPAGRAAGRPIEVTFSYDLNERMHCVFLDVESGMKHVATLCPKGAGDAGTQRAAVKDFIVE